MEGVTDHVRSAKDKGRIGEDQGYSKLASEEPDSLRYSFSLRRVNFGPICIDKGQRSE